MSLETGGRMRLCDCAWYVGSVEELIRRMEKDKIYMTDVDTWLFEVAALRTILLSTRPEK